MDDDIYIFCQRVPDRLVEAKFWSREISGDARNAVVELKCICLADIFNPSKPILRTVGSCMNDDTPEVRAISDELIKDMGTQEAGCASQ